MTQGLNDDRLSMARRLGLNLMNLSESDVTTIDHLIGIRPLLSREDFDRRIHEMMTPPAPTLHTVMRELAEMKKMIADLQVKK